MDAVTRVKSWFGIGNIMDNPCGEGNYCGPAVGLGEQGNTFCEPVAYGYQRNLEIETRDPLNIPAVHRCVMATAEAVSQCRPKHHRETNGQIEELKNSTAAKVLRNPNHYQTWTQFITNAVILMKYEGEAFAYIKRVNGKVTELHLYQKGQCAPYVDPDNSALFYSVGANPFVFEDIDYLVSSRDILHLRQHCIRNPMKGESDISAAMMAIGINLELSKSQLSFFGNGAKPSGILSTDLNLTKAQILELRAAFDKQSKSFGAGGLPILSNGLKFNQMGMSSVDSQLLESKKLSTEEICMAFGVPLPVLGLGDATYSNTESLVNMWLSISLGALLENIERSLDLVFNLPYNEHIDLDVAGLLRSDFDARINGLTKGVQGGLYKIDEARKMLGLGTVEGGDSVYLQRQMTDVSHLKELEEAEIASRLEEATKPDTAPAVQESLESAEEDALKLDKKLDAILTHLSKKVEVVAVEDIIEVHKTVEEELFIFKEMQKQLTTKGL